MANEATIRSSLQIRSGHLNYQSQPVAFQADVAGAKGPVPGAVQVDTIGTDIYFSELDTPGLCRIQNLDTTNYVEWGIYDTVTGRFSPVGELLPGETFVFRLSRNFAEQYTGSGTGTTGAENYLRFKANQASCNVLVEAFER